MIKVVWFLYISSSLCMMIIEEEEVRDATRKREIEWQEYCQEYWSRQKYSSSLLQKLKKVKLLTLNLVVQERVLERRNFSLEAVPVEDKQHKRLKNNRKGASSLRWWCATDDDEEDDVELLVDESRAGSSTLGDHHVFKAKLLSNLRVREETKKSSWEKRRQKRQELPT